MTKGLGETETLKALVEVLKKKLLDLKLETFTTIGKFGRPRAEEQLL